MSRKILYDIEVYINYFCVGLKDHTTKEITFYEISEQRNDIVKICAYFKNFNGFLISFNGIHYDNMVISYMLANYNRLQNLSYEKICKELKTFSDKIINDGYDDEIKYMKYYKHKWTNIDLFLYWSKMLRISKKISLKSLGIQLGYPVVQELPYKPDSVLTIEDLPKLRHYNYTHDLGILEMLTDAMDKDIRLRSNISSEYDLDCWSWDAPKIASEALLQDYCKITGNNESTTRKLRHEKPTLYLNKCLEGFEPEFKLPIFKQLWFDILNSKNSFSKDLLVNEANTSIILTYGVGGLHAVNENEQYYTDENFQIITSDVASMYPNIISNYMCIRFPEVLNKYRQFGQDKKDGKREGNKAKEAFSKLILNSTSGLIDMEHSWLYYPEGAMRLRLIGQLILTKFIEVCIINNWQVISANTDGIEVIVPKHMVKQYEDILNMTCRKFNLDLEHEYYNKIIYKNVNNYVAHTAKGKIKRKGLFLLDFDEDKNREIPLGNSVDELVINKALNQFYLDGTKPDEFISNPDKYGLHIYDYCKSNKISKDFTVYWNNEVQQNLNRYYFSKKSPYLFKRKHNQGTFQHVNVGEGVWLFNNYENQSWASYNINYQYYIRKTQTVIDEINRYNQLTLF